ncbi:DgyrCDS11464 [Dimorphilus gyrociliatus]|uniref:DgyrCDS11464 n=1 Tax=Dimorphilus gyrociliatus TaxID=2664684 RepID=A0A7I8W4C3_9ANNE|nr:DgyrCDS11464 [Dimorphilus gyrociliatus]
MRIEAYFALAFLVTASIAQQWGTNPENSRALRFNYTLTPLDEYILRYDPNYSYDLVRTYTKEDHVVYVLNMTSQMWRNETDSDHPVWWHWLAVAVPNDLKHGSDGFIYIGSGNNRNPDAPPNADSRNIRRAGQLCVQVGAVAAYLWQIPNQPIRLREDDDDTQDGRVEDSLIALTWRLYLEDPTSKDILLRLPMTKAVVKAMDTIEDFIRGQNGNTVNRFMLSGASKRGWTTWTTAAFDVRVKAMAPTVLTILNMYKNLKNHYRSLGGWTFVFGDYWSEELTTKMETQEFVMLRDIVDPYSYRERFTMPTLVVAGSSDEFFLPDESRLFFNDLPADAKYMWLVENAGHSITSSPSGELYWVNLGHFWKAEIVNYVYPKLTNELTNDNKTATITITTSRPPLNVAAWYAYSLDNGARDFRLRTLSIPIESGIKWHSEPVTAISPVKYTKEFSAPTNGTWLAFFLRVEFLQPDNQKLVVTSEANVVPDTYVLPECFGEDCLGFLV